jgi:hypothetical protein
MMRDDGPVANEVVGLQNSAAATIRLARLLLVLFLISLVAERSV